MASLPDDDLSPPRMTSGVAPIRPPRPERDRDIFQSLAAGVVVGGKYRLVRCLGEGGMATVWVAHNEALDIEVAIKFIRTDLTTPKLAERLLNEARAAAKLGHPAIVRVFDFGETRRGDPYIVMELLHGEDLSAMYVETGRMTPISTLRTLLPIAHALAVAHDKGIVHRDLKPENVFLARAEDGQIQPKLLDFGVAKLDAKGYERLTQAGTALGSPAYMSPEQARGDEVDQRSDLWSFCVVLYEALSGTLPFHHENYNALMRQIIELEPTPLTELAAGDAELWEIIRRGLTKDLDQRWSSMRSLGIALASWLLDRGVREDLAGSSLAATWLHSRQSWVDGDGVFERLADSGLHPAPPGEFEDSHPSKAETLRPSFGSRETPAAGTPVVSIADRPTPLELGPPAPTAPSKLPRTLALIGLGLAAAGVLLWQVLSWSSTGTPATAVTEPTTAATPSAEPSARPPQPATTAQAEHQSSIAVAPASSAAPAPAAPSARPEPRGDTARQPPSRAPAPTAAVPASRPAPPATRQAPPPAAEKPQPKPRGGLEIKTSF